MYGFVGRRAEELRILLAEPSQITLERFNHEVWRVETAAYLGGTRLPAGELFEAPLDANRIGEIRRDCGRIPLQEISNFDISEQHSLSPCLA
jgi:hypothetical protein